MLVCCPSDHRALDGAGAIGGQRVIYFTSFGSDIHYESLSYRLLKELSASYPRSFWRLYSAQDLPADYRRYAARHPRGFGYWMWKPLIIRRTLDLMADGDVMLYADGRSGMAEPGKPIPWFDAFVADPSLDVAAWQQPHLEAHWTSQDLLSALAPGEAGSIAATGQYSAGLHAWRAGDRSRKFAADWLGFMTRHPHLCRDEPSALPNHPDFRENRHDQSVFSLLLKMRERQGRIALLTLDQGAYEAGNLRVHRHSHPHRQGRAAGSVPLNRRPEAS